MSELRQISSEAIAGSFGETRDNIDTNYTAKRITSCGAQQCRAHPAADVEKDISVTHLMARKHTA